MSLRLRLLIAALALGLSTFAIFGDAAFVGLGLPSGSGRIVIAAALLVLGLAWFAWTSVRWRRDMDFINGRRKPKPGSKHG